MIPLAELHVHIEGAANADLVRQVAERNGMSVSHIFDENGKYKWHDFASFLKNYDAIANCFITEQDYSDLAYAYYSESAKLGSIYTEIIISPDHARQVGLSFNDYVSGLLDGFHRARDKYGIEGCFIATGVRHFGVESVMQAAHDAYKCDSDWLRGFHLSGDERVGDIEEFAPAFQIAKDRGLGLSCHLGEFCGPETILPAVRLLDLKRIGHGVQAINDLDVVKQLNEMQVTLEICPTSNIKMGLYEDHHATHPIQFLMDMMPGLITVSSDDPAHFDTNILQEYERLDWDRDSWIELTNNSILAGFCDDDIKNMLLEKLI